MTEQETADEIAAWILSIACAPANRLVDQTDPSCPVGTMLTEIAELIRARAYIGT